MCYFLFPNKFNSFVCWQRLWPVISGRLSHLARSACWEGTEYIPHGEASLLLLGGRRLRIYHLDPCPSVLRPHLAAGSLLAAVAWEAFHCFLECFLTSLQGISEINLLISSTVSWWLVYGKTFPVLKLGGGEVFILHPPDWPVRVMGHWFVHLFAVALFYLSCVSFIVFSSSRQFKMKCLVLAKPLTAVGLFAHAWKWDWTQNSFLPLQSNAAGGNFLLILNLPYELFHSNHFNFCCPGKDPPPPQQPALFGTPLTATRAVGICTLQPLTAVLF